MISTVVAVDIDWLWCVTICFPVTGGSLVLELSDGLDLVCVSDAETNRPCHLSRLLYVLSSAWLIPYEVRI